MSDSNQHVPPQPVASRGIGAWLAYLLLIAVLLIASFAIWLVLKACGFQMFGRTVVFHWCQEPPAIVRNLADLENRNRFLRNQIHDAQLGLMTPEACGSVVDLVPEPEPDPVPDPQETTEPTPEEEPIDEAAHQCEPDQVLQQPNEVAIVLDGSGSMQYSVDVPEQLERQYLEAWNAANNGGGSGGDFMVFFNALALQERVNALDQQMRNYPGRSRMSVAREVMDEAVRRAPSDVSLDLTYFNSCASITSSSHGTNRDSLRRAIAGVSPDSGTPLAQAIQEAAGNLEGGNSADDPVNMVVVTDGNDSCQGDPCAVARALKRQKPGLVINVVDLSQTNVLSCVSEATGGTYRRSRGVDLGELVNALQEAAGYRGAGQCREVVTE